MEQTVKSMVVQALKSIDDGYADWMVTVYYRAEPPGLEPDKRLPRPSALPRVEGHSEDSAPLNARLPPL